MTHGADFLFEPLRGAPSALDEHAGVAPGPALLAARCGGCHGGQHPKAGLVLTSAATALRGGDDGAVIVAGDAGASALVRRLRLPLDDDDHMPPAHKPQLAPDEIEVIAAWIDAGAPGPDAEAPGAPGAAAATETIAVRETAADASALAQLADALVHVQRIDPDRPLLLVDVAAAAPDVDDNRAAALLDPIRGQIADLSLARSAVGDRTVALLATMPNLRRVDLTATAVTDEGLAGLPPTVPLEEIVLCSTAVGDGAVETLAGLSSLRRVHTFGSRLTEDGAADLRARRADLVVEDGRATETAIVEIEEEVALDRPRAPLSPIAPINRTCPVTGAPVDPRYVIVHEGKVIGFCCDKCPSAFWADPGAFEVSE
jgi:mono/diheme cytochrome c family protein